MENSTTINTKIISVPDENIKAYKMLYSMENAIRMLIVDCLEKIAGEKWWKDRLPGDILKDYKESKNKEQRFSWISLVPHHPIYYVDFPSLKKVIEKKNNWDDVFKRIFGNKEMFSSSWSSIEPIRNKVAHNRCINESDIIFLNKTLTFLTNTIGESHFKTLAGQSKTIPNILSHVKNLKAEGKQALEICESCDCFTNLPVWRAIFPAWWFDDLFIGQDLSPIKAYFGSLEEYILLPRKRGEGYKIERWVREKNISKLFSDSDNLLDQLEHEGNYIPK